MTNFLSSFPPSEHYLTRVVDKKRGAGEDLKVGSHVRVVKNTFENDNIEIGDIGVVVGGEDGLVIVDFTGQRGTTVRASDIVVDLDAQRVRTGARVVVKPSVDTPRYGWGNVKHGMIGFVHHLDGAFAMVNFGFANKKGSKHDDLLWRASISELEVVQAPAGGELAVGSAARVRRSVTEPRTKWANLSHDDIGIVRSCRFISGNGGDDDDSIAIYTLDFPSKDGWICVGTELEVDQVADRIRPMSRVKLQTGANVSGVAPDDVGIVKQVNYDGRICVAFPNNKDVKGHIGQVVCVGPVFGRQLDTASVPIPTSPATGATDSGDDNALDTMRDIVKLAKALGLDLGDHLSELRDDDQSMLKDEGFLLRKLSGDICVGSHVRVVSITHGAGHISIGDIGVARSVDSDGDVLIDFPQQNGWCAAPHDIVIDETANHVRPGAIVRVKPSVEEPACGWGDARPGLKGFVHAVTSDGKVKVHWGLHRSRSASARDNLWTGKLSEMECVPEDGRGGGRIEIGQAVRVKRSVSEPRTLWGSVSHDDVGYVRSFEMAGGERLMLIDFPEVDGWNCFESDLEVDETADAIRPLARVRIKPGSRAANVTTNEIGFVKACMYDGRCLVAFNNNKTVAGRINQLVLASSSSSSNASSSASCSAGSSSAAPSNSSSSSSNASSSASCSAGSSSAAPSNEADLLTKTLRDDITVGSHVRVVHATHGLGEGVSFGDIGVACDVDSDGDVIVHFPNRRGWVAGANDLVVDGEAQRIRPGALVKVKLSVEDPAYGWGSARHDMIGLVHKVNERGIVSVQFGYSPNKGPGDDLWRGMLKELVVVAPNEAADIGTAVCVRPGTAMHRDSREGASGSENDWHDVSVGGTGFIRSCVTVEGLQPGFVVDFGAGKTGRCKASEVQVEACANLLRPMARVMVRPGAGLPSLDGKKGGGVRPGAQGFVKAVSVVSGCIDLAFPGKPLVRIGLGHAHLLQITSHVETRRSPSPGVGGGGGRRRRVSWVFRR